MFFIRKQIGVTLIELTVVLLILVALAGVTLPYIGGTSSTALCNATDVTMQNVKKVIMERYYLDTLGYFPKDTKNTVANYNLKYLFTKPTDWNDTFDPATQTGWRGPYLQSGFTFGSGQYLVANLDISFRDETAAPNNHVHVNLTNTDTVILDAWGRPIILQIPDSTACNTIMGLSGTKEGYCARLVSAGAGNGLAIDKAAIETPINGHRPSNSDDRILYLNAPTPAADVNPPCNEN